MAVLTAIGNAINLLLQVVQGVKSLAAFIQANQNEAWFKESAKTFVELRSTVNDPTLNDAQRADKLRQSGRNIRDLIGRM